MSTSRRKDFYVIPKGLLSEKCISGDCLSVKRVSESGKTAMYKWDRDDDTDLVAVPILGNSSLGGEPGVVRATAEVDGEGYPLAPFIESCEAS